MDASNNEIVVRPGTADDAEACWRLFQAHLNWINVHFDPHEVVQRATASEFDMARVMLTHHPSAVAVHDTSIVGFTMANLRELGILDIMNLYVDDPYRSQGLGRRLLDCLEGQAVEQGICGIVGSSSANYYPIKMLPERLFQEAGYQVIDLGVRTQLYVKRLAIDLEASQEKRKVKRIVLTTYTDMTSDHLAYEP